MEKKSIDRYVDGDNGNDDNNGKSWGTATSTLQGGFDSSPFWIDKPLIVHIRGSFDGEKYDKLRAKAEKIKATLHIGAGDFVIVDGGE